MCPYGRFSHYLLFVESIFGLAEWGFEKRGCANQWAEYAKCGLYMIRSLAMVKAWLVRGMIVFSFGFLSACQQKSACKVGPSFFCDEFDAISREISPETLSALKSSSRGEIGNTYPTFGMYVRNRFSLWGDNETTRFFRAGGVNHADSMSYVMTVGFVGYLNGEAVDMAALSRELAMQPPPPPPPIP